LAATAADAVSGDTVRGFQNHPKTASCATSPIAACFKRLQCVGRVTARPTLEQWRRNMINNHFPTVFGVLSVLAALAAPANAAESAAQAHIPERPAVATPGNAAEAQVILGAKLLVCNTCHGENGVPKSAAAPVISGQQENYLIKQLHDFQSGDRNSDVMTWMATSLTPAELGSAAASFAKKNWPARSAGAASASPPGLVAVCQVCHQQNFVGGLPGPRLAGQSYEYLVEAMRRFADGERTNNADMTNIMKAISPAERETMARYISAL
jgi:cytochrome c553